MRRDAIAAWVLAAQFLVLTVLARPAGAQLGCFREEGFSAATCSVVADCGPVGGSDCTSGFCLCSGTPTEPFCPCAIVEAPVLSPSGSLGAAALVAAIGLLGLWRTARMRRDPA